MTGGSEFKVPPTLSTLKNYLGIWISCLYACLCSVWIPDAHVTRKGCWILLGVELQMLISDHVMLEIEAWFFGRAVSSMNH